MARSTCQFPNGKDAALALEIARGESIDRAARNAGVSLRTAYRRVNDPDFRELVREARARLVRGVAGKLAGTGDRAVDTIAARLCSADDKVALTAAKAILEYLHRFSVAEELEDMAEQLAELRTQIGNIHHAAK